MAENPFQSGDTPLDAGRVRGQFPRDHLTGLLTMQGFRTLLMARLGAEQDGIGIVILELRGLARFNDEMGRVAGDDILLAVARRLDRIAKDELGASIVVARIDGARFAIIAPEGMSTARMRMEGRAIVSAVSDILPTEPAIVSLRLAVGSLTGEQRVESGLSNIAKRLAAPASHVRAIDIDAAIHGDALTVHFQPQVAMNDDTIVGAEALVRWNHPRLGEISGALLFSAAVTMGLQRRLSLAVWSRAFEAMATWPRALHHVRVAINLTADDITHPHLVEELLGLAEKWNIATDRIAVELTEAAIVPNLALAERSLTALRQAGVKAALDDFGTGYSGLSWLRHLPVDYIKIDSSFVGDSEGEEREQAVLKGVVSIAQALDLDVLAEGVETPAQRDWLRELGCRWFQGYLCSPALPSDAFVALAAQD